MKRMTSTAPPKAQGVTLIELMIVVVILGILASVALPAYRQFVIRADRQEATSTLLRMAANQEKWYLQNNTYTANLANLGFGATTQNGKYTLAVNVGNVTNFQVQANAAAGQTDDADCPVFAIDETGFRYGGPGPISVATNDPDCWRGR